MVLFFFSTCRSHHLNSARQPRAGSKWSRPDSYAESCSVGWPRRARCRTDDREAVKITRTLIPGNSAQPAIPSASRHSPNWRAACSLAYAVHREIVTKEFVRQGGRLETDRSVEPVLGPGTQEQVNGGLAAMMKKIELVRKTLKAWQAELSDRRRNREALAIE